MIINSKNLKFSCVARAVWEVYLVLKEEVKKK